MKLRYVGKRDRYGVQLPIGVRHRSAVTDTIIIGPDDIFELEDGDAKRLLELDCFIEAVDGAPVAVASDTVPAEQPDPPKRKRGRPRKNA